MTLIELGQNSNYIQECLYHLGDTDTRICFYNDRIRMWAGGVDMIDIIEDAVQDRIIFNNAEADVDFRVAAVGQTNAFFVQGSTGKIGMGINVIPVGGRGYALQALHGANANAAGPHIQFTTALDNYPLLQLYNWAHDEIGIIFDAYYDGAWRSSDVGSNFRIGKGTSAADLFSIEYDSGIAQGAAITWNDGIVVGINGFVGIRTTPLSGALSIRGYPAIYITHTLSDDSDKYNVIAASQWDQGTETEGFVIIGYDALVAENKLYIGGGRSDVNTATRLGFYTAANVITHFGTEQMRIESDGGIYFYNLLQQSAVGLVVEYDTVTGEIYAETSAKKFKKDIRALDIDTSKLLDLVPKTYVDKESGRKEFGLIAEEVADIIPDIVVFGKNNNPLGIKYTNLSVVLLNEVKSLNEKLSALRN